MWRPAVYASDPHQAPDADFEPGALYHLVPGRAGRLLDPRRTPVRVLGVDMERGFFEVEVLAFEDVGARWQVPLEACARYQFSRGPAAASALVGAMEEAVRRFEQPLHVPADAAAAAQTRAHLAEARAAAGAWLDAAGLQILDLDPILRDRIVVPQVAEALESWLAREGLADLDGAFASTFASNPHSGELVKGHAVVLAELGLHPFTGTVIRDGRLFEGQFSRDARRAHLVQRMGFVQALFARARPATPMLYRGLHFEPGRPSPLPSSFVSATLSLDVASAHFGAGGVHSAGVLLRQPLPLERLLMTFVETRALSERFQEAEVVLIGSSTEDVLF